MCLIRDLVTGDEKGYGFVEFYRESHAERAYEVVNN